MSTTTQGHQLTEDRIERIGLPDSVMAVTASRMARPMA
jgi:hypothetical protein